MHDLTSVPQTNPVDLYRVRDAIYAPDMLLTALVHLDLFSWLDQHPSTKEDICRGLEITDRPTDVMRRRSVGRALLAAAEDWAIGQGCTEFASDALLTNTTSAAAHLALGFNETVQLRCFKKTLRPQPISSSARP